jgi:ParB-like chromosome segregation protein Spo0J
MATTKRVTLAIDKVIPNPRNDRRHPRSQIDLLKQSIERFGQPKPILARTANHMIIAGAGVHQAMAELGRTDIEVLLWDVDQATADQYLVADNRFSELSDSDPARRRELLEGLDDDDFPALGFLPDEVAKLFDEAGDDIAVEAVDTEPVADRFWISVYGPLPSQALALKRLQELMSEIEGVEVDLGTMSACCSPPTAGG